MSTKISALTPITTLDGTESLPAVQSATTKRVTAALLAAYTIDVLADATAATPTTGDVLLGFRSDVEKTLALDDIAAYGVAYAWDHATTATAAASGDTLLLERSNAAYSLTVDLLKTYVLTGMQATALNLSGLSAATLGSTDYFLVGQGSTAKSTTLSALETKLWADYLTYVSALSAVTVPADADILYTIQSGTAKSLSLTTLASYIQAEVGGAITGAIWDAAAVDPALSTDVLVAERSGATKTLTVDTLSDYVITALGTATATTPMVTGDALVFYRAAAAKTGTVDAVSDFVQADLWTATTVTSLVSGDTLLLGRSGAGVQMTVAGLASAIQPMVLDYSGLSAATLSSTDQFVVVQGTTPLKTTLSALETKLWADRVTYTGTLTAVTTVGATDVFTSLQGGTEKKVTPVELATYVESAIGASVRAKAFDADAVAAGATGDLLALERSGAAKTITIDLLSDFAIADLGASASATPTTGDSVVVYRAGAPKLETLDAVSAYATTALWDTATTITTAQATDTVPLGRSGASQQITLANLQAYVLTGVQATALNLSGLASATLGSTDQLLVCQSGVAKSTTISSLETKLWADFATYTAALTDAATLVDGDKFYLLNGSTAKYGTALELATYISGKLWAATDAAAAVTGDTILIKHSGTIYELTVDLLSDFIVAGEQATLLNVSGLASATLASTDFLLVNQGSTPKSTTVAGLAAKVHDGFAAYTAALTEVSTLSDEDDFYVLQAGTARRVELADLAAYCSANAADVPWEAVLSARYTATPATTSTLTMSDTTGLEVGLPIRFTQNAVDYYAVITAVSANAQITIAGAPFDTGLAVSELAVGLPQQVVQVALSVDSLWDDAVQDVLASVGDRYFRWDRSAAHLVSFGAVQKWPDSGATQPKLNVKVNAVLVSTGDAGAGITLSAVAGTWVDSSAVAIDPAAYRIERGEAVELRCTAAGATGDAEGLTVNLVFILE